MGKDKECHCQFCFCFRQWHFSLFYKLSSEGELKKPSIRPFSKTSKNEWNDFGGEGKNLGLKGLFISIQHLFFIVFFKGGE